MRGVRANLIAGVTPSEAAIVDAAAARGVEVVRSHRHDIDALRGGGGGGAAQYSRSLRPKISETDLSVSLPTGAEIRLFGGTTRAPLVYLDGVVIKVARPMPRGGLTPCTDASGAVRSRVRENA